MALSTLRSESRSAATHPPQHIKLHAVFSRYVAGPRASATAFLTLFYDARPTARRKRVVRDLERRFPERSGLHDSLAVPSRTMDRRSLHAYARSLNLDVGLSFYNSVALREFSHGRGRRRGCGTDDHHDAGQRHFEAHHGSLRAEDRHQGEDNRRRERRHSETGRTRRRRCAPDALTRGREGMDVAGLWSFATPCHV